MKVKNNSISLGRLAKQEIIKFIEREEIQPDERLPSENELMEMLGVSRYIVREALALLEQDSVIYKIQGKGTFVKKTRMKIESGLEKLESISDIIKNFGYKPSGSCLKVEEITPTKDMREKLNIGEEEKAITFTRIRTADGKIAAYCVDTIPKYLFKDNLQKSLENISMFNYLEEEYSIEIEYAVAEIIPVFPTKEMREVLNVSKNKLFLLLHQIHCDKEGIPIIYSMDYFNPEVFKFKINRVR